MHDSGKPGRLLCDRIAHRLSDVSVGGLEVINLRKDTMCAIRETGSVKVWGWIQHLAREKVLFLPKISRSHQQHFLDRARELGLHAVRREVTPGGAQPCKRDTPVGINLHPEATLDAPLQLAMESWSTSTGFPIAFVDGNKNNSITKAPAVDNYPPPSASEARGSSSFTLPTELDTAFASGEMEGTVVTRVVNGYERSKANRQACIEQHGLTCRVCDFNFEEFYGTLGKDFIEVHHKTPLSEAAGAHRPDPRTDLVPVCSNCHQMLHRRDLVYTVEGLKELIRAIRAKSR